MTGLPRHMTGLPRHSYLSWSHLSKWIWIWRCQWYAIAWWTTAVSALLAEKSRSFPSPSSIPAPSVRPMWKWSWQSRLCAAPWKEPVQLRKLKLLASLLISDLESVAENVQPISYANKMLAPEVWISLSAAAMGYLALFVSWERRRGEYKIMLTTLRFAPCPLETGQYHDNRPLKRCPSHPWPEVILLLTSVALALSSSIPSTSPEG